jgi:hypothetical protein
MTRPQHALVLFTLTVACGPAPRGLQGSASTQAPAGDPAVQTSPSPATAAGADFVEEARLLERVVGCAGESPLPSGLSAAVVTEHCKWMTPRMDRYRQEYAKVAAPFLANMIPASVPGTVIYPFGGGDLLSALTTFPKAAEIDTISLELAGDPRRLPHLKKPALDTSLGLIRGTIGGLLTQNDSTSESLMKTQQGDLPGELSFFVVALAIYDLEPVSLRYFRIEKDGSLHYLTKEEIASHEKKTAKRRNRSWTSPDFSEAFANSELSFKPRGKDGPVQIHRHIGANLGDDSLSREGPLLRYLEKKGRLSAMTKAASYCLWNPNFTHIRDYLLKNVDYMVSDSTGIPPEFTEKAGLVQETYGSFAGSFLDASTTYNDEFKKLWAKQTHRKLPFRYGYVDSEHQYHMIVTKRAPPAQRAGG